MTLASGYLTAHLRNDPLRGTDAPSGKFFRRKHARPGIENLHGIDPGLELPDQISSGRIHQLIHQTGKSFRIAIGEHPCRLLVWSAVSSNHVACYRPRRTAEAQQRNVRRKAGFDPPDRFVNRSKHAVIELQSEPHQSLAVGDRIELRPLTRCKSDRLPERMRNHQNIGKQDRSVEAKPTHRLQRHLGRQIRRKTQREKISRLFPQRPIFRQIASGLPHQPYGWRTTWLMIEHVQNGFMHREIPGFTSLLN